TFLESRSGNGITLVNEPEGKWPRVSIEIALDASSNTYRCRRLRIQRADDSVRAWLLSTRFMFCVTMSEGLSIAEHHRSIVKLVGKIETPLYQAMRSLSAVVRKLAYLE